jgi:hypothetical protein
MQTNTTESKETVGLPFEKYNNLTLDGKILYNLIYYYCTYSDDPQYRTLHKFRNKINKLTHHGDKATLIEYFNHDPAIRWNGISCEPWEYYSKPY